MASGDDEIGGEKKLMFEALQLEMIAGCEDWCRGDQEQVMGTHIFL